MRSRTRPSENTNKERAWGDEAREAERFVQTFKKGLRCQNLDPGNLEQKLAQFLLAYRTTPHTTTGVAPSELFLKWQIRTRLDLLRPSTKEHVSEQLAAQKRYHDQRPDARNLCVERMFWF